MLSVFRHKSIGSTVLTTVYILFFNPDYLDKITEKTEYLVIHDEEKLFVTFEELSIHDDWKDKNSMACRCYSVLRNELIARSSGAHNSTASNEDSVLLKIIGEFSKAESNPPVEYKVIILPIHRLSYEKLSNSSWKSDTEFTVNEIYGILAILPRCIEKGSLMAFLIFKNLINDTSLYLQLEKVFAEKQSQRENPSLRNQLTWYDDILALLRENCYFVLEDRSGGLMAAASEHEKKCKIPIYVGFMNDLPLWISTDYLAVDHQFFKKLSLDKLLALKKMNVLTCDIDLTGLFNRDGIFEKDDGWVAEATRDDYAKSLHELLNNALKSSENVETVVVRISSVLHNFDFSFMPTKKIHLHYNDCHFDASACLPENLVVLHISHSTINGNLELPEGLCSVVVEHTDIVSEGVLVINNKCEKILIRETKGNIVFPCACNFHGIVFPNHLTKVDLCRNPDDTLESLIIVGAQVVKDTELGYNTKKLFLENVQVSNDAVVKIHQSCNNITLKNCMGCFDLAEIVMWGRLRLINNINAFKLVRSVVKNIYELSMMNINYAETAFLYSEEINFARLASMSSYTDLYLKMNTKTDCITSHNLKFYLDIPLLMHREIISRINQTDNCQFYQCDDNGKSKIILKNAKIKETMSLAGCNFQKIALFNVQVAQNQTFKINATYENLSVKNCTGRFIIPGIVTGKEEYIDLPNEKSHIWFYKVGSNAYNCELSCLSINYAFKITHKLQTVKLSSIKMNEGAIFDLAHGCENLYLSNCKGFDSKYSGSPKKIIVNAPMNCALEYKNPLHEVEISSFTCVDEITNVLASVKKIRIYRFEWNMDFPMMINHECEQIIAKKITGGLKIPLIMKPLNDVSVIILLNGTCIFDRTSPDMPFSLFLENASIDQTMEISASIHSLSLESVAIKENAALRVNESCEVISINKFSGDIDFEKCSRLRSLTLKNGLFIYYEAVYANITFLHLENVEIRTSVHLSENIQSVKLVNVKVKKFKVFEICENCKTVYIHCCKGDIITPQMANINGGELAAAQKIIIMESRSENYGRTLFLGNMNFYTTKKLDNDTESVILRNLEIKQLAKLVIGECCKYLKLDKCNGSIDVHKILNLRKLVIINCTVIFNDDIWKCVPPETDLYGTYKVREMTFPDNIKSVELVRIVININCRIVINTDCEEVSIDECQGCFDLSAIKYLKRFKLIPKKSCFCCIDFPDLSHVEILEMSYHYNCSNFKTLLTKCVNVKKLILHDIVCKLHDQTKEYAYYNFRRGPSSFEHGEFTGKVESETDKILCAQSLASFSDFRSNCGNLFKHFRYKTLRHLSITGFNLDEQCLEHISNFVMLETLSIVSYYISAGVFSVLPPGLKEFIVTPMLCLPVKNFKITPCEASFNGNKNVCYRMLRYLKIHSLLFMKQSQFIFFPSTIEFLEIIPSIVGCSDPSISRKMKAKELVISELDQQVKCEIENIKTMEEYYDGLLNMLSYFIDFSGITRIAIRDGNFKRSVEPRDYVNGIIH